MNTKTVNFKTNYNKKLDCPFFLHIDTAPPEPVPESALESTIVFVVTIDASHPPVKTKVINLVRLPLKNVNENLVRMSHGISKEEFVKRMKSNQGVTEETEIGYYFYMRIDE